MVQFGEKSRLNLIVFLVAVAVGLGCILNQNNYLNIDFWGMNLLTSGRRISVYGGYSKDLMTR